MPELPHFLPAPETLVSPEGLVSTLQVMLLMAIVSLAPAVLLMTTCFVRVVVVLGLLRQALGTQQLPPNQVTTSIALFVTLLVMTPVWTQSYESGVEPYTRGALTAEQAWQEGIAPVRKFMSVQIEHCGNSDDVWLFLDHLDDTAPQSYEDVPLTALLPAFMLSELKTAFLIGFQVYLPFIVLDLVISSVLAAMGMLMLPPALVSLPFKLLLFVLVDGWHLVVGMLLESFQTI
jgi:flagellar biosynthetic protein FliP